MIKLTKDNLYFLSDEAKQIDLYDVPGPGGGKAHLNDTLDDYLMEFDGYRESKPLCIIGGTAFVAAFTMTLSMMD